MSNKTFLGDYNNPEFDSFKMVMKLKDVNSDNPKAPVLRGFLVITKAKLQAMLEYVEQHDKPISYVDIALWPARDAKYRYEGSTSLKEGFDVSTEAIDAQRTPAPTDIYRI